MHPLATLLVVSLAGLAQSGPDAPPPALGYPVFVQAGRCEFGVQDMLMDEADLARWMADMPDKSIQVDVVTDARSQPVCIKRARATIAAAGFDRVRVRRGSGKDYGGSLPIP